MADEHPEEARRLLEWVWPDGKPIIIDETLEPEDFEGQ